MCKKIKRYILLLFVVVLLFPSGYYYNAFAEELYFLGGQATGFILDLVHPKVVGFNEVITADGNISPAKEAGLTVNDKIISICGIRIEKVSDIERVINNSNLKSVKTVIERDNKTIEVQIKPAKEAITNKKKIGCLLKESISGIGTITCINKSTLKFYSLGHGVIDSDELVSCSSGNLYQCSIVDVKKGVRGNPGELRGVFICDKTLGSTLNNTMRGVSGKIENKKILEKSRSLPLGKIDQVKIGNAKIVSTIEGGEQKEYCIQIVKVDQLNQNNKNFVIKITDPELLEKTGGIVQGMSGSPIIQNEKIIGAVTHVFINDPTRGYGIAIDKMINE